MFIHILKAVGVLCHFEGLLSCYGDEMGALEDMVVGIDDLRRVLFWLEPADECSNPQPRIEGSRYVYNYAFFISFAFNTGRKRASSPKDCILYAILKQFWC